MTLTRASLRAQRKQRSQGKFKTWAPEGARRHWSAGGNPWIAVCRTCTTQAGHGEHGGCDRRTRTRASIARTSIADSVTRKHARGGRRLVDLPHRAKGIAMRRIKLLSTAYFARRVRAL